MALISTRYSLLPSQQKFMHVEPDVTLDVCIYQGGYGSGKTWVGSLLGILLCQKYPGIRGLVLGKTYPLIRDTTLRAYREHLDQLGLLHGKHYSFHTTEARLVFHCWGNSEILFRHLQEPDKIKSINAGWVECEEMSQFSESDFHMVLSRVRQTGIPRYRVFGHTNPQPNKGWIQKYFLDQNQGKQTVTQNGQQAVIHYRRVIASTYENIYLSPHYIENMKNQFDEAYFKMNVLGEDGDYHAGLVCNTWSHANIEDTPYLPDLRIYLSCDFNVDPMSWVVAHRYNDEFHFIDEICLENTTTLEAAEEFVKRYADHPGGIVITGDASGDNRSTMTQVVGQTNYTLMRNRLSELGMRNVQLDLRPANPPILDRVMAWNMAVCNGSGVRRVKINPRCKWLVYNCENLKYIPGTSRIWEPTSYEVSKDRNSKFIKHIWDAASYLVERYNPIQLRIPNEQRRTSQIISRPFDG